MGYTVFEIIKAENNEASYAPGNEKWPSYKGTAARVMLNAQKLMGSLILMKITIV